MVNINVDKKRVTNTHRYVEWTLVHLFILFQFFLQYINRALKLLRCSGGCNENFFLELHLDAQYAFKINLRFFKPCIPRKNPKEVET